MRFLEKIQRVGIYHKDDDSPLLTVYKIKEGKSLGIEVVVRVDLFNIKPNAEYVLSLNYITSKHPEVLNLLSNAIVNLPDKEIHHQKDGYGNASGFFYLSIPFEEIAEYEISVELSRMEEKATLLDTYTTYFIVESDNE